MRHPLLPISVLTLAIACGGEGDGVSTPPPSTPSAVAAVAISIPSRLLVKGDTARAQATVRDVSGIELTGRTISWASSSADVASVSGDGLVQALAAGTTTISATSEGKTGTIALTVDRALAVTSTDTLLAPGKTFTLRGEGMRSARVSVSGTDAVLVDATDSSLVVTVPFGPWYPCIGPGTQLPIAVTSGRQAASITRAALEQPQVVDLAIGAYHDVPASVLARACRLQLPTSGTYLALPFVPERSDAQPAPASDSLAVVVRLDDAMSSSGSIAPVSLPRSRASLARAVARNAGFDGAPPRDVVPRTSRSVAAAACPLPPLGSTVPVRSARDSAGRLNSISGTLDPDEPWTYVAQGQSIAVFADSATVRMAQSDQRWGAAFNELIAISDTSIVPFLNAYTRGFPDNDLNGKLIVYATGSAVAVTGSAQNSTMRSDCSGGGEAIVLALAFPPDTNPYVNYGTLSHEMGHIVDWAWNEHTSASGWAIEGFASFLQNLYLARTAPDPLAANLSTLRGKLQGSGIYCVAVTPFEAVTEGLHSTSWDYAMGCSMVGYLIALYRDQKGGTTKDAIMAWSRVPNTNTMEDVDSYFGVPRGASRSFGHWLLSWYADDYIAGIPAELRQPLWDIRQIWMNDLTWRSGYALPDVTLSATTPSASFTLGAPDERFVELVAPSNGMLSVTRTGRVPTDLNLIVFRAR